MGKNKIIINYQQVIKHPVVSLKRLIHPIFLKIMPSKRDFDLKYINQKPEVDGPVLYLVTHANSHDAPVSSEVIKDHFYILVGKQPLEFVDEFFFNANGKIEADRDDKESTAKASDKMKKLLNNGVNVVMYPEGTWCVEPSKPINHCKWGWVDIAKETGATVMPIALEYYELTDNCCYVNFGKPFKVNKEDDKQEKNDQLEETFATLKYEIWTQFPEMKRSEVDEELWDKVMKRRYDEYKKLNPEKEKTYIYGINNSPENVFGSKEYQTGINKVEEIYGKEIEKSR